MTGLLRRLFAFGITEPCEHEADQLSSHRTEYVYPTGKEIVTAYCKRHKRRVVVGAATSGKQASIVQ